MRLDPLNLWSISVRSAELFLRWTNQIIKILGEFFFLKWLDVWFTFSHKVSIIDIMAPLLLRFFSFIFSVPKDFHYVIFLGSLTFFPHPSYVAFQILDIYIRSEKWLYLSCIILFKQIYFIIIFKVIFISDSLKL